MGLWECRSITACGLLQVALYRLQADTELLEETCNLSKIDAHHL